MLFGLMIKANCPGKEQEKRNISEELCGKYYLKIWREGEIEREKAFKISDVRIE